MSAEVGIGAGLIGANNRDLTDLSVDVTTATRLLEQVPAGTALIAESGYDGFVAHEWRPGPGRDAVKSLEQCFAIMNV